jgi:NADPH:quinone reductase-like Zn-dependent oxidoreductase
MKAATRERYGGPDIVRVEEVEKPVPTGDQVLVRVAVASVNRADLDSLYPKPSFIRLFAGIRAPRERRLGVDVAGEVEAVGPEVTRLRPGDRVFADLLPFGGGAFAEYVVAPEKAFLPIPDGMSFETAATLPHAAVLAVQGFRKRDGRTPAAGSSVLIDGASGNVGPFAIQVAKARGYEVTAVASGPKLDFVRALGADHVIDYRTTDYTKRPERYDWIMDVDAHHPIGAVRRALKPGGTYVSLGGTGRTILRSIVVGSLRSIRSDRSSGLMLWWKPFNAPDVATVTGLVEAGKVMPAIDRTFPLDQVVEALRWVDDGHARGKVLVRP